MPRVATERVAHLVRHHMFRYEPGWSDAAVRRFIGKVGPRRDRRAVRAARGRQRRQRRRRDADELGELRERVAAELEAGPVLDRSALAIDGDDLIAELGLAPGPALGRILDELLERVIDDPALNEAPTLLLLARDLAAADR